MDILSALEGSATSKNRRCKIGRWFDEIPADQPGRDDLVATFETTDPKAECYRRLDQLDAIADRLGFPTSIKTIGDHRAERCRCSR
jgi:hypothetical protein